MCEAAYTTWGHREPDSLCVALKMSFKKHLENPYNALPYPPKKKLKLASVDEDVEKLEPLYIALRNVK